MKNSIIFYSFAIFLILGCKNQEKDTREPISNSSHSTVTLTKDSNNIYTDIINDSISELSEFKKRMGKGIMSLNLHPSDADSITLYPNTETDQGKMILRIVETKRGWALDLGKDKEFILQPFKYATNFENFGFIWTKEDAKDNKEILLNKKGASAWVKKKDEGKYRCIEWKNYLIGSIFTKSAEPIFNKPGSSNNKTGNTSGAYRVLTVKENWIQIAPLDKTNPSQIDFNPIGWIRWFRDGEIRISIADDTRMEDYYYSQ